MFIFKTVLLNLVFVFTLCYENANANAINQLARYGRGERHSILLAILTRNYVPPEENEIVPATPSTQQPPTADFDFEEEAPCLLHSIRDGCICRLGDRDCDFPPAFSLEREEDKFY
ncbi:hypothetical protein PPYR_07949 [Photinus pyralis]|uniref:Uncharacterized protein n=1 Tax=Photinus pyralis TaxID=7054 RepID=A0A5N4ARY5_PHOPY|nr:uncharacterized protein LOC116169946 [Photinus pyralis]KAB0800069.1 hypothetical protein PPYR_07949 [Photinus pyralis]